jgi:hypothetical protein
MLRVKRMGVVFVTAMLAASLLPPGVLAAGPSAASAAVQAGGDVRAPQVQVADSAASATADIDAGAALAEQLASRDPVGHVPAKTGAARAMSSIGAPLALNGVSVDSASATATVTASKAPPATPSGSGSAAPGVATYAINGTLRLSDSTPLGNVNVDAKVGSSLVGSAVSDVTTGAFSIAVPAGSYKVGIVYPNTEEGYWYTGGVPAPVSSLGNAVVVSTADVTGVDLTVPVNRSVSGTVKWGITSATTGNVTLYDLYGNQAAQVAISTGNFSASVRPGKYLVAVDGTTGFASSWYGPGGYAISSADATVITVGSSDVTGINVVLPPLVAVSGTASSTGGTKLPDIYVETWVDGVFWGDATTDAVGHYSVQVPPGSLELWFFDLNLGYAGGWYAGGTSVTPDWHNDHVITVTTSPISGINVSLATAHYIIGHVTETGSNVPGIILEARINGSSASIGVTDATGYYGIPVSAATYTVFEPGASDLPSGWYGSAGFTIDESGAASLTVSGDITGIDLNIPSGFVVSGHITNEDGTGLNAVAEAFHNGALYDLGYTTQSTGQYSMLLASGSYTLAFADPLGVYGAGWYNSSGLVRNSSQATTVAASSFSYNVVLPYLTVPGKPTNVVAQGFSGGAVVTWKAPANDGGTNITKYTVTSTPGSKTCTTNGALRCNVSGLTNGTPYQFRVTATNSTGTSAPSDLSASITPTPVPGPPNNVTALPGNAFAMVSWTVPDVTGGSPITHYTVTSAPGSKTCTWTTGALTCKVTGLTNGLSYTFTVTATNGSGTGPASWPSAAVIPVPPATFHAMTPARLLDTRSGNGMTGKLYANTPRTFQVTGRGGVPSNAVAVTGNVTVVGSTAGWAVYLGPAPIASPSTSTINFLTGQVAGNGLTVALSKTGSLAATYISSTGNHTDLVFDVTGYFTPDTSGATYHPMTPARLLDTRSGNGLTGNLKANTPRTFVVAGRGGVPAGAVAVTGNVTVVGATNGWAAYLGPSPLANPSTSTVNFSAGQVAGNNLTVSLSNTGTLSATYMSSAGNTTDMVFDVTGYYTADATGASFMPLTPVRLLDTRSGNGHTGKLSATVPVTFSVAGRGGVPTNAVGVTGNVTVVGETAGWAVYLGPNPVASPSTSTINFVTGDVKGNGLTVALGSGGNLSATYISSAGNTTDLVFDVTGYFIH